MSAKHEQTVLKYLKDPGNRAGSIGTRVDVLDRDFVDHFIEKTDAKIFAMPYGAHKCPTLGRTLTAMYRKRLLDRSRTGIEGMAGMGFPRWVYSYRLKGEQ